MMGFELKDISTDPRKKGRHEVLCIFISMYIHICIYIQICILHMYAYIFTSGPMFSKMTVIKIYKKDLKKKKRIKSH